MNNLKGLFKRQTPDEEHRNLQMKKAIAVLKEKQLKFVKKLGTGAFGDVIAVKGSGEIGKSAVKIIRADMTWEMEITHWKELDHPNVLPLLDYIPCNGFDLFLMPLHPKALHTVLKDKKFRSTPTAFDSVKSWMRGVLSGLAYLHERKICHLDVKANNVLITDSNTAVLLDYSCINTTTKPVSRYGLMTKYLPPEAWRGMMGNVREVDGISFDIWSFGMLMLNALTGEWYKKQLKHLRFWREDAYPHLFKVLQPKFFESLVHKTFSRASVSETEIALALNLIQSCLRFSPEDRPQVSAILQHSWVSYGIRMLHPDRMWKFLMLRGSDFTEKDNSACPTEHFADTSTLESQNLQAGDASHETNKGSLTENFSFHAQEEVEYIEDVIEVDHLLETEDFADFTAFEDKCLFGEKTQDPSPELAMDPILPSLENDGDSDCTLQEVRELLDDVIASIDADSPDKHGVEGGRDEQPNIAGLNSTYELSPFENFADFSVFETDSAYCGHVSSPIGKEATSEIHDDDVSPGLETTLLQGFDSPKKKKNLITRVRGWFRKTFKFQRNH